jgi:hypothetical protein
MTDNGRSARSFDAGLQPERTALAWRRTALAVATVSLIGLGIIPERVGPWALLSAGMGLVVALVMTIGSHFRYRSNHSALTTVTQARILLPDGRFLVFIAALTALAGFACLLVVTSPAAYRMPHGHGTGMRPDSAHDPRLSAIRSR